MNGTHARRRILSRRTLMRGLGTVAVGLPFMDEMLPRRSIALDAVPPTRVVTLFFGLGIPREQTLEKWDGPLQPLEPLQEKLSIFTNLDLNHAHKFGSGEPHFKVGNVVFVGDPQKNEYDASGPSMEQIAKRELHPGGVPTSVASKSMGMWFRTGSVSQYTRHWNHDGSPGERPERRPTRIFEQFFGAANPVQPDPGGEPAAIDLAAVRAQHLRRSILDVVKSEYEHLSGGRSPLGAESKVKLSVHLDQIRDVEQRLAPTEESLGDAVQQEVNQACLRAAPVTDPGPPDAPYDAKQGGTGAGAPVMAHEHFSEAFQLQGKLMALALRCDVLRFGSMLFVGAGGHVGFRGTYNALGGSLDFNKDLPGTSSHDGYFHKNRWDRVRLHQHYSLMNIAGVLSSFDDPAFLEANGKTVLDNTLVVLGTCYGGGGSSIGHQPSGVFHAIAGGNGHFKAGFNDTAYNPIDVYHTALGAYGIDSGMGAGRHKTFRHEVKQISEILA